MRAARSIPTGVIELVEKPVVAEFAAPLHLKPLETLFEFPQFGEAASGVDVRSRVLAQRRGNIERCRVNAGSMQAERLDGRVSDPRHRGID